MKNKLLIVAMFCSTLAFGQITGTKYIPSPDYGTIAIAFDSLNTYGVGTGGVTFNIFFGYSEEITSPLLLTATGSAGNPVLFKMDPALPVGENPLANPLVRRTDAGSVATSALEAQGDAVIIIQGGDYITFDGIDVQAISDGIEYGYFLRRASTGDGCKNVTIRNSNITMTKGTSAYVIGIYSSNLDASSPASSGTGLTLTSAGGSTENLVITGNTIGNVFGGIAIRGYNHASPYTYMDQNNIVGMQGAGNTIRNFAGNSTASAFGVHLYYQTSPNISYNTIDNAAGGGTDATGGLYAIWHQLSNNVGDFVASNNAITMGFGTSGGGGTAIQATPPGLTDNSIHIQNNTFGFGTFDNTGTVYLISCSGAKANNITITGNATVGNITRTSASGPLYGYYRISGTSTGGTHTVSNNNFSNITLGGTGSFTGIDCRNTGNGQIMIISDNTVTNITAGGTIRGLYQSYGASGSRVNSNIFTNYTNTGASTGSGNSVLGMMLGSNGASVSLEVYENTITELKGAGPVYGIWSQNGTENRIFRNNLYNLRSNTSDIGPVYGMIINGGVTTNIYNNFISDLISPFASGDFVIMGVYVAAGTNVNMYYNTIYLNASTSGTAFGTAGIYAKTEINFEMRNNIVVNRSNHLGNTGYTVAYRRFDANMYSYTNASDNNDFYVSSDLPYGNYIYCDGSSSTPVTAKDSTMADYQARVAPRDAASFSENPPFVNGASAPYDLHINPSVPTLLESGGASVASPLVISNDRDGDIRWGETGYTGSGTAPDVGADEFGVMTLTAVAANAACPASNDGAIDVTVSDGNNPFTYLWSNGATTQDISGLAPGMYTITVTDFTSVQATHAWTVGLADPVCDNSTVTGVVSGAGCYNAYLTLTVSGLTVTAPNGQAELISGQNIMFMPGTVVEEGAWLWGHISATFCQSDAPMVAAGTLQDEQPASLSTIGFSLYPNPTNGNFTLVQKGERGFSNVTVAIYNMNGRRVMANNIVGEKSHEFSTSSLPMGIYVVKVVADDYVETIKLIKTK